MLNIFYDILKYMIIYYIKCNYNGSRGNNSYLLSQWFLNVCRSELPGGLFQTLGHGLDQSYIIKW